MRKILISALFALALAASAKADVAVGAAAPDFSLTSEAGRTVKLSDYKGKLVVLEWVNQSCPFVRKHYGADNMQALQKKYTAKGVVWLSVCSSGQGNEGYFASPQEAADFKSGKKAHMTHVLLDPDGTAGHAYGAKTTPHMFVIAKDGTVAYEGAIDDKASTDPADIPGARNYVAQALDEILAGKPVSIPATRSYGCGVKYKQSL